MNVIELGDMTLEPQTADHADEMYRVLSDPAIYLHENRPPESPGWLRDRFTRLESRRSPDGQETWLNWIVRLAGGEAIGYVQATVREDRRAMIAYVFGSRYWGRGHARRAVQAMMGELARCYAVRSFVAVFNQSNVRSRHLLDRLGFAPAPAEFAARYRIEPDEVVMERAG